MKLGRFSQIRRHLFWVLPLIAVSAAGLVLALFVFILPQLELNTIKRQVSELNQAAKTKTLTSDYLEHNFEQLSQHKTFNRELSELVLHYLRQETDKIQATITVSSPGFTNRALAPTKPELNQPKKYLKKRFSSLKKLEKSLKNSQKTSVSPAEFIQKRSNNRKIIDQFQDIVQLDLTSYSKNNTAALKQLTKLRQTLTLLQDDLEEWRIDSGKITILKRAKYQKIKQLLRPVKLKSIVLVKDKDPPDIAIITHRVPRGSPSDIQLFSCVDAVDDRVECKISQRPDYSKTGTYKVKVSATDQAKNSSERSFTITVYRPDLPPYYIKVSKTHQVVMVYALDSKDNYTQIVKTFVASTGLSGNTPVGVFNTRKYSTNWAELVGNVWGQYPIQIVGFFWFHSVPYFAPSNDRLEWEEYNKLGQPASAGCVRLSVVDVKWLYDNIPDGTKVEIYNGPLPPGVSKPSAQKLPASDPRHNWDPTDPAVGNPWR